jgi:hypothetical protein
VTMSIRILALGPLSFKVALPSESKVIGALNLHNKSLPIKDLGQAGRKRNSCFTSWLPRLHYLDTKKGWWAWFLIAPVLVACFCKREPTGWVTINYSAPP